MVEALRIRLYLISWPNGIVEVAIDIKTGLLVPKTAHFLKMIRTEIFIKVQRTIHTSVFRFTVDLLPFFTDCSKARRVSLASFMV